MALSLLPPCLTCVCRVPFAFLQAFPGRKEGEGTQWATEKEEEEEEEACQSSNSSKWPFYRRNSPKSARSSVGRSTIAEIRPDSTHTCTIRVGQVSTRQV